MDPIIDNGVAGYYGVNYDAVGADASAGINWGGLGSTLTGIAQVWGATEIAKTKSATPLYQYGPNGQLYREGVPVSGMQQAGGISPLLLLLIVGGLVLAMKD